MKTFIIKLLIIMCFGFAISDNAVSYADKNSIIISPFIFPVFMEYYDIQASYEKEIFKKNSIGLGAVYNYKNFPDARIPGSAESYGLTLFYRFYFEIKQFSSILFIMPEIELLKAKANNASASIKSSKEKTIIDFRIISGMRNFFTDDLFYELGLGFYYRPKGLYVDGFTGYRKGILPAVLISVGSFF